MIQVWHEPGDFSCEVCRLKPLLREHKGCGVPGQIEYIYPPLNADYDGERIRLDSCPVWLLTPDVMAVFRAKSLADGKLTVTEQEHLPGPILEAWDLIGYHQAQKHLADAKVRK